MSELQALERHWEQYKAGRFNAAGPMIPEAEIELRMAFYAGAYSILGLDAGLEKSVTEGQRDAAMKDMRQEVQEFFYLIQTPTGGSG